MESATGPPGKSQCKLFQQTFSFEICIDLHAVAGHNAEKQVTISGTLGTEYPVSRIVTFCSVSCSVISGLFVTPWTVALQAPLTMEFARQEYWSGLPFPSPGESS